MISVRVVAENEGVVLAAPETGEADASGVPAVSIAVDVVAVAGGCGCDGGGGGGGGIVAALLGLVALRRRRRGTLRA